MEYWLSCQKIRKQKCLVKIFFIFYFCTQRENVLIRLKLEKAIKFPSTYGFEMFWQYLLVEDRFVKVYCDFGKMNEPFRIFFFCCSFMKEKKWWCFDVAVSLGHVLNVRFANNRNDTNDSALNVYGFFYMYKPIRPTRVGSLHISFCIVRKGEIKAKE